MGAGLGELEADDAMAVSLGSWGPRRACWGRVVRELRLRCCSRALSWFARPTLLLGEGGTWRFVPGDEAREPALNGWKETEVRRGKVDPASDGRRNGFEL